MKNLMSILSIAAATNLAYAGTAVTGPYVGAAVGRAKGSDFISLASSYEHSSNITSSVHAGITGAWHRLYCGIETHFGVTGLSVYDKSTHTNYKHNWYWGANTRLGFLITQNSAVYILAGSSLRPWRIHDTTPHTKKCISQVNPEAGLGFETTVTDTIKAGLELRYILSKKYEFSENRNNLRNIDPSISTCILKVSYVF
jgi:opacity protein-like surface antigen